jgi:MOSC domain-containing protein YiiM
MPDEANEIAGRVEAVYLARGRGEPRVRVDAALAVEGRGLEGDRYFGVPRKGRGNYDPERQVTLIEAEAIDAVRATRPGFGAGDARRNVVTRGVRLNDLVGKTFRVGEALFHGVERCDPCRRLEKLTYRGVMRDLDERGGLRAVVLRGGAVREGDAVAISGPAPGG